MITYALGRELSSRRELQCPINAFIVGYVCALYHHIKLTIFTGIYVM